MPVDDPTKLGHVPDFLKLKMLPLPPLLLAYAPGGKSPLRDGRELCAEP